MDNLEGDLKMKQRQLKCDTYLASIHLVKRFGAERLNDGVPDHHCCKFISSPSIHIVLQPSNDAAAKMMDSVELTLRKFQIRCEKAGLRNDKLFIEVPSQTPMNHGNSSTNKTFVMPTEAEMWNPVDKPKTRGKVGLVFFQNRRETIDRKTNEEENVSLNSESISLLEL
uniref:Ras-associating domain-containing protein n=1 Tax=Steinernema glaseri TaxID=37863 RepID=A0A1I7YX97_9BILA